MANHRITVTINREVELVEVPSQMTLMTMLREKLAFTGTKNGCNAGECGACTVLLDGEPVNSCMVLAVECDGRQVSNGGRPGARPGARSFAGNDHRARRSPVRVLHPGHINFCSWPVKPQSRSKRR